MRMFETWNRDKVLLWINHIEEAIATGATAITNPDTGTVSYDQRGAYRALKFLYRRLDVLDGKRPKLDRIRTIVPRIHPDR